MKKRYAKGKIDRNLDLVRYNLREMVQDLGLGFHPDTKGEMYRDTAGMHTFTPIECEYFNANLETMHAVLGENIYAEAIELWAEFGMIDNTTYAKIQKPSHITDTQRLCFKLDEMVQRMEEVSLYANYYLSPPGTTAPTAVFIMRGAIPETHEECHEFLQQQFGKEFSFFQEVPLGVITVWSK